MACKTCEQKEKKNLKENQETVSIKLLPEQIAITLSFNKIFEMDLSSS